MTFNDSFLTKVKEVNNIAIDSTILESFGGGFVGFYGILVVFLLLFYVLFLHHFDIEDRLKTLIFKKESFNLKNNNCSVNLSTKEACNCTNVKYNSIDSLKEYFYKFILIFSNEKFLITSFILSSIITIVFSIIGLINSDNVNSVISKNLNDVNLLSDITYSYDISSVDVLNDEDSGAISYLIHYQKPNDKKVYHYETENISYSNDSSSKIYFFDNEKVKELDEYLFKENINLNFHIKTYFSDAIIEIDSSLLKNK